MMISLSVRVGVFKWYSTRNRSHPYFSRYLFDNRSYVSLESCILTIFRSSWTHSSEPRSRSSIVRLQELRLLCFVAVFKSVSGALWLKRYSKSFIITSYVNRKSSYWFVSCENLSLRFSNPLLPSLAVRASCVAGAYAYHTPATPLWLPNATVSQSDTVESRHIIKHSLSNCNLRNIGA